MALTHERKHKWVQILNMSKVSHGKFEWLNTYGFEKLTQKVQLPVFRQISQPYQKEFRKPKMAVT